MHISKFLSIFNVKRNVIRHKTAKTVSSVFELVETILSDLSESLRYQAATVVDEIIKSKDSDKILHGSTLLFEGLKSVDWSRVATRMAEIQKQTNSDIKESPDYKLKMDVVHTKLKNLAEVFNE